MKKGAIHLFLDEVDEGDNKEAIELAEKLQHSTRAKVPGLEIEKAEKKNGYYDLPLLIDTNRVEVRGIEAIRKYVAKQTKE